MSRIISRFISHEIPFIVLCLGDSTQKDWFLAFLSKDSDRVRSNVKTSFHFSRYKNSICEVELSDDETKYIRNLYNQGYFKAFCMPFGLVYEVPGVNFRELSKQPTRGHAPTNSQPTQPHLLTLGQAAYRLKVPRRVIRGFIKRGELSFITSDNDDKLFKLEDLNRLPL